MNTLIKILRARNHDVIIEGNETYAVIFREKLPIKFKEKVKIIYETDKYGWRNHKFYTTGILLDIPVILTPLVRRC
jgi:hypothetical protein